MGLGCKVLLVAAALVCAAAPALGADATFTAVDTLAWRANGTDATSLTIAPGQTVTFGYPSGMNFHNLHFVDRRPDCTGVPTAPRGPGWSATCTFSQTGSYPFVCDVHAGMQGKVEVEPAPTPTATPTADPGGPVPPAATPTPAPTPSTTAPPRASLDVKLAGRQKGARVRGTVRVAQAASRVEVTVRRGRTTAGRWQRKSAVAGTVKFSVALNASARRMLRAQRRLALTVTVKVTPPGARALTTTAKATVSL